jgi:hypothetical protein
LAILAGVVALWLARAGTVTAGCGDYLDGVESGEHAAVSMPAEPHGRRTPTCRSCHLPIAPAAPVITFERVPVDPAFTANDSKIELNRGGWRRAEALLPRHRLSQTPDRPPKV